MKKLTTFQDKRWTILSFAWEPTQTHEKWKHGFRTVKKSRYRCTDDFNKFWKNSYDVQPQAWQIFTYDATWDDKEEEFIQFHGHGS